MPFLDQSQAIQLDLLKSQLEREQKNRSAQEKFVPSVDKLEQLFSQGFNISIATDSPADTKIDLGEGFINRVPSFQRGNKLSNDL